MPRIRKGRSRSSSGITPTYCNFGEERFCVPLSPEGNMVLKHAMRAYKEGNIADFEMLVSNVDTEIENLDPREKWFVFVL